MFQRTAAAFSRQFIMSPRAELPAELCTDHHASRIDIGANVLRHNRRICHPEVFCPTDAQVRSYHGVGIYAHAAGSNRMESDFSVITNKLAQGLLALDSSTGRNLRLDETRERILTRDIPDDLDTV